VSDPYTATAAEACEQVLQRMFVASVDLVRSLRHPDRSETLVRGTINDLDEAIRILRPVVATLSDPVDDRAEGGQLSRR
jgi:hypothetical protein